jgi:predicted Zn-dependent protease
MKLEQTAFGSTYPEHEVEDRVDHLEKEVLGGKTEGSISDRISKLEAKLGGAGAFGHTNTAPSNGGGRGSRSSLTRGDSEIADASGNSTSQVPFPGAQSAQPEPISGSQPNSQNAASAGAPNAQTQEPEQQQPLAAVAQSLGGPPVAGAPGESETAGSTKTASVPTGEVAEKHVPVTAPLPPIPLPTSSPAVPSKHSKPPKSAQPPHGSADQNATHSGAQAPSKGAQGLPKNPVNPPEVQAVVDTIPSDPKAGDYFSAVKKFDGDTVARWTSFPVTIKLPPESPDSWKKNLQVGINEWNRYIPLQPVTGDSAKCDIEVTWVNKLLPGVLGITRLTTPRKGSIHVEIWMLRPTFYAPDVVEHALQVAFMHELGHAVGIFGHSSGQDDLMASAELSLAMKGKAAPKSLTVEPKDLNTLKQIYETPALPSGFMLSQPIEWSGGSVKSVIN